MFQYAHTDVRHKLRKGVDTMSVAMARKAVLMTDIKR